MVDIMQELFQNITFSSVQFDQNAIPIRAQTRELVLKTTWSSRARVLADSGAKHAKVKCNYSLYELKYNFVETPRKFIIAELSIRKLGSSSVLIIMRLI